MTDYIVLQGHAATGTAADLDSVESWTAVETTEASSAKQAIRAVEPHREGVFVAVPARSWKPLLRKVQRREIDLFTTA
jgi:hypothetical protein